MRIYTNLLFSLAICTCFSVYGQTNTNLNSNSNLIEKHDDKDTVLDLGFKKITRSEYLQLKNADDLAKVTYQKMIDHPKLLKFSEKYDSTVTLGLKKIELSFDAKEIRFNSLFVKMIVENENVKYVHFSLNRAYIYVNPNYIESDLLNQLNIISLTKITKI